MRTRSKGSGPLPRASARRPWRKRLVATVAVLAVASCCMVAGCAPQQASSQDSASAENEATEATASLEGTSIMVHAFTDNDAGPFTDTWYNTNVLNAGSRGCSSCHADMYATISNIQIGDYKHIIGKPANGKDYTYRECTPACHMGIGAAGTGPALEDAIHSIHFSSEAFVDGGGICESCHAYNAAGELVLWDDLKYTAELGGYPNQSSEITQGWNAMRGVQNNSLVDVVSTPSIELGAAELSQPLSDDDDIFVAANVGAWEVDMSTYQLTVSGVNGKSTWTIDELKELPATEKTITQDCAGQGMNGALISNFTVTGVSLSDFIEACGGLQDGMVTLATTSDDQFSFGFMLDVGVLLEQDTVIGYAVNGHDLTANQGYPVTLYIPGFGGNVSTKYLTGLTFSSEAATYHDNWMYGANAGNLNAGWLGIEDGYEAKVGETVELAGWGYVHTAGGHNLTGVAISADYGQTWTTIDMTDKSLDPDQWVQFKTTWTPEKAGTYVLKVKALDNTGATFTNAYTGEEGAASVIVKVTE